MQQKVINRCENCGGLLNYDVDKKGLLCSHCASLIDHVTAPFNKQKENYTGVYPPNSTAVYNQLKCTRCNSLVERYGEKTINCPSCGSSELELTAMYTTAPDGIVPFTLSKDKCGNIFKRWIKRKFFAPHDLKKLAKIKNIKPIYYPCYLFDCTDSYNYSFIGVDVYKDKNGREHTTRKRVFGSFVNNYMNISESGTTVLHGDQIRTYGPFDLSQAKLFDNKYLYGMLNKDLNINPTNAYNSFHQYIHNNNETIAKQRERSFDRYENYVGNTTLSNVKFTRIFMPIWTTLYSYKQKDYNCYINGNTGEIHGKTPVSVIKVTLFTLFIIAIIAGIAILANLK